MDAARLTVCRRVLAYRPLVDVDPAKIERWLVLAVIAQESLGNPYAIRPEPAFWRRYGEGFALKAKGHAKRWCRFPDVASASYGLMQTLYVTAVELGFDEEYPTALCEPAVGIFYGCKKLRQCFTRAQGETEPIRRALLFYNGGGDHEYDDRVLAWRHDLMEVAGGD